MLTSNKIDSQLHTYCLTPRFCQHPDGSFLVSAFTADNYAETGTLSLVLHGARSWVLHHFDADFQYIRQYNTDLSCNLYGEDYNDICCTDSGEVVIAVGDKLSLYRITNETLQVISSTGQCETSNDYYKRLHSFKNRIYMYSGRGELYMLDAHLNKKKSFEFVYLNLKTKYEMETGYDLPMCDVVPCLLQKFFYIDKENAYVICEYPKQKQLKYLQEEGFRPQYICAASEDSVFVLGRQGEKDSRILQVNTDMEILSDILLEDNEWDSDFIDNIVFDRVNARLIMYDGYDEFKQIYLE